MERASLPIDLILSKLAEDAGRMGERIEQASEVLTGPLDTRIAVTAGEVIYREDRLQVKLYRPETRRLSTPLLVVYALINRETMLDLQPGRSVVQSLLAQGIEVYMVEWGYPTRKDRFLTIDDHVNGYMDRIVDVICERHGIQRLNLMGICMGGTFSVIYAALHPKKVRNLITTVTPTSFDTDTGLLHIWMKRVDVDRMIEAYGNIPGDLLNLGFLLLNPARLMLDKYVGFMENMHDRSFVENFVRMERWIFDSPDVPGETFRQFISDFYQRNLLIQNRLEIGGRRVDLKRITMPLLNIYGRFDHLVPPAACEQLTAAVGGSDTEDLCLDTGHIGIYVSSKTQKEFVPKITQWLGARDLDPAPVPAPRRRGGGTRKAASAPPSSQGA
jgi:polyhydroxyalkanoate synthase